MSRKETSDWKIANKNKGGWNVDKVSTPFFLTYFPPDLDNKQLWSICEKRVFNSVPVDVPVAGPVDVDVDGSGIVPTVSIATVAGPTVEVIQGLCDDNVSTESLSQPPSFRRDAKLDPGTSKIKSNSASSHGSSRLLKKRVSANIEDISDIMKQYVEMGRLFGYDMEGNKDKVKQILASIGVIQVV
ncbi:unnamed protein product [Lactuca virosa]|uniref:No apical meristem-associated C-terminal domain-containing protein n=1 Tax=Lactuca virosa TaxID=75947 RepID=A0AAU9N0X6_9ASTR|nr:unnamed protein product [Lactuca virosa]